MKILKLIYILILENYKAELKGKHKVFFSQQKKGISPTAIQLHLLQLEKIPNRIPQIEETLEFEISRGK